MWTQRLVLSRRLGGTVFGILLSSCFFGIHPAHPVFAQNQNQSPALLGGRSAGSARVGDSGAASYAVPIAVIATTSKYGI